MKKIICLVLACMMVLCVFAACGDNAGETGTKDSKQTESKNTPEKTAADSSSETKKPDTEPETKGQSEKGTEKTDAPTSAPETKEQPKTEQVTKQTTTAPTPETQPPATQPPATQPPATQPPVTQPPSTQPPATQPPATDKPQIIPVGCDHSETFLWNEIIPTPDELGFVGYSGDLYCKKCNTLLKKGNVLLCHLETGKILTLDSTSDDPLLKTLKQAGRPISHLSSEVKALEIQMCDAVNAERAKYGLAPLKLVEEASWYSYQRAVECYEYAHRNSNYYIDNEGSGELLSHTRPNGLDYSTLYNQDNIFYFKLFDVAGNIGAGYALGENLVMTIGDDVKMGDLVAHDVTQWMNSPTHRENILNDSFTRTSVSIYCIETDYGFEQFAVQHFYA